MNLKFLFPILLVFGGMASHAPARPATVSQCREVISQQEAQKGIPEGLLRAIATIESGISPWAINERGRAHIFKSKEAAAHYARKLLNEGFSNFSLGCMQLHYASHHRHFKSVEAMLEPENNIAHAAKLIKNLERRHGSLEWAIKFYHSASPAYHNRYKNRVWGAWAKIHGSSQMKRAGLKTVTLKKETPQKAPAKVVKRVPHIKFGVGAASQKNQRKKA